VGVIFPLLFDWNDTELNQIANFEELASDYFRIQYGYFVFTIDFKSEPGSV